MYTKTWQLILLNIFASSALADPVPQPPYFTDTYMALENVSIEMTSKKPQVIELSPDNSLVALYILRGSGITVLDAYVYHCDKDGCSLYAFVRTPHDFLEMKLENGESEMVIKSSQGIAQLRAPAPIF